jgi:hypothetical protein
MVEADDIQSRLSRLALDADQLLRGDVIAIVRRVGACVAGADRRLYGIDDGFIDADL